jgi:hypothetical protein
MVATLAVTVSASLVLGACGSDDSSSAAATTAVAGTTAPSSTEVTTTDPPTTEPERADTTDAASAPTTEPGAAPSSAGGDLVGQWVTDAGDILATLTEPFGGAAPACSGPYVLTFRDDGTVAGDIDLSCQVEAISASGELGFTGDYTDDGSSLQVSNSVTQGNMSIGGTPVPLPITDGLFQAFSAPASYTIDGDVLSISFTSPDGVDYTLQFERLA